MVAESDESRELKKEIEKKKIIKQKLNRVWSFWQLREFKRPMGFTAITLQFFSGVEIR